MIRRQWVYSVKEGSEQRAAAKAKADAFKQERMQARGGEEYP